MRLFDRRPAAVAVPPPQSEAREMTVNCFAWNGLTYGLSAAPLARCYRLYRLDAIPGQEQPVATEIAMLYADGLGVGGGSGNTMQFWNWVGSLVRELANRRPDAPQEERADDVRS